MSDARETITRTLGLWQTRLNGADVIIAALEADGYQIVKVKVKTRAKHPCSVEGCYRSVYARGLCGSHWMTNRNTGFKVSPEGKK